MRVRQVERADEAVWRELFRGYRDFYALAPDEAVVDRVWSWLHDDDSELHGLVVEVDGVVVALTHHRAFLRPTNGTVGTYLDDLFVAPESRGRGAARALIDHLGAAAVRDGRSVVRWITAAEDNAAARGLYDTLADATHWVTYDLETPSGR